MISLKLLCFVLVTLFRTVYSHGMLCTPRQRGAYHSTKCGSNLPFPQNPVTDHCAHCLNGGTVATVSNNLPSSGWAVYDPIKVPSTRTRAGLCGDPAGDNSHMIGGAFMPYRDVPIVTHWQEGSNVDLEIELDTNHNGYFEFFLCNLDTCQSRDIAGKCMQNGHCHRLNRIPHPDCEKPSLKTHFECGPIDKKYPSRWYVPCRKTGHVGVHLVGGARGTMKYRLPKGLSCNHCVLQWYWATGNSCAPRGFLDYFKNYKNPFGVVCDSDGGGRGAHRPGMATCGGKLVPEEFWSCADVKISPKGTKAASSGNGKSTGTRFRGNIRKTPKGKVEKSGNQPSPMIKDQNLKRATNTNAPKMSNPPTDSEEKPETETSTISEPESSPAIQSPANNSNPNAEPVAPNTAEDTDSNSAVNVEPSGGNGSCISRNEACDGKVPCCGPQTVCVYTQHKGFACKLWYTLWKEVFSRA